MNKTCNICKEEKSEELFHWRKKHKQERHPYCKECYSKTYNKRTHEQYKNSNLRKSFGISLEDYQKMLIGQDGVCAICKQKEKTFRSGRLQSLSVDHSHETGKIRGLLCNSCNRAIGKMGDDWKRLLAASEYLKRSEECE